MLSATSYLVSILSLVDLMNKSSVLNLQISNGLRK